MQLSPVGQLDSHLLDKYATGAYDITADKINVDIGNLRELYYPPSQAEIIDKKLLSGPHYSLFSFVSRYIRVLINLMKLSLFLFLFCVILIFASSFCYSRSRTKMGVEAKCIYEEVP